MQRNTKLALVMTHVLDVVTVHGKLLVTRDSVCLWPLVVLNLNKRFNINAKCV